MKNALLCRAFSRLCAQSGPWQEVTFVVQDYKPVGLDGVQVVFDDERAVSDAGVMLVALVAQRLGRSRRSRAVWCGCAATGQARPTRGAR